LDVDDMNNNQDVNVNEKTSLGDYFFISVVGIFLLYCLFTILNIFAGF
jgi:hypothetical protein